MPRTLEFKVIADNVDSNRKLLKKRHNQLNNQRNNQLYAITVNQRNVSSCTSELEHHRGGLDKKMKDKHNMRIRDCCVDGT